MDMKSKTMFGMMYRKKIVQQTSIQTVFNITKHIKFNKK